MSDARVLVVSPRFPLPLHSGTQLRVYHTLRALSDRFDVTLVALLQDGEGSAYIEDIESLGVDVHSVEHRRSKRRALLRFGLSTDPYRVAKFGSTAFGEAVRDVTATDEFDLAWVHFLSTMPVLPPDLGAPVVLDQHNEAVRYWASFRRGHLGERIIAWLNQRRLRRLQNAVVPDVEAVLSASAEDADVTRQWVDAPVWVVPNGIDTEAFTPERSAADAGPDLLFVGSLGIRMNEEAIRWFVEKSWRDVLDQLPDARLRLVGRDPSARVRALNAAARVEVIGPVPAVAPYYDEAAVVVAPHQFGGGTKLKVLEALAMARGIVATPAAVAGIEVEDGTHALVRERGPAVADAVVELLEHPGRRERLGRNGRAFVCERYDWTAIMDRALDRVEEVFL